VTAAFGVSGALTGMQDAGSGSDARVLLELARAGEMLAREDTLLTSAQLIGSLDTGRQRLFTGAVSTRRSLVESSVSDLRGPQAAAWRELAAQDAYRQVQTAEDDVLAAPAGRKAAESVPATAWDKAHRRRERTTVRDGLRAIETEARRSAAERTDPVAGSFLTGAGAAVLLGLSAVAVSLVISVRIGRALVVELISLRNSALVIASHKLPHAMRRLRTGGTIDIQAEAPPGPLAEDEIGQVGGHSEPFTGPRSAPPSNAPNSPTASPASSSTSRAAARPWSTAGSPCSTPWSAAPTTRTNSATSSASITSPPVCAATQRA
jgi:hypothetical protein